MNFEDELRNALRREEPAPDFARRVLARTEDRAARPWLGVPRWAQAGALALLLLFGGLEYRHEQQRLAGERAKQKLMLALRITGSKLQSVQQRVQRHNQEPTRGHL